ncbi:hypothetical protein INT43_005963 [Umbelopsis isabellina]|uniref:Hydrophobic surface binding protein A-domain-containing protein n=1 Tax=Mortierella isabellina TaxID=91625 RepID=A0A8H7PKI9_MORIS|nr:hypothetical protein INT43_005963 [Umbelopsis isabellina]
MRVLGLLSIAMAIATAQAAALNKRVTAPVATEITDLQTIVTQLAKVNTEVSAYTASQGYGGALKIAGDSNTLQTDVKKATTDCGAITGTVSDSDATAVLNEVAILVPQVQATLQSIVSKKSVFASVPLVTPLVTGQLTALQKETASLDSCLLSHTPSDQTATAQGYITQINTAFTSACSAYGVTC